MYDRSDRVDIMITFDTPYEGSITQNISQSKIIIKLNDASIESPKSKEVSSNYLQSLTITPMTGYAQITALVPNGISLQASKTSDGYGLRLRFINQTATTQKTQTANTNSLSSLPTKKDGDTTQAYYVVVTLLVLGILILFFLKRKIALNQQQQPKIKQENSWLFKENKTIKSQDTKSNSPISIQFQKNINHDNSVVMLDFADQSYLILIGTNNILLDKFVGNKPVTQEDFETILQNRHQELDHFLNSKDSNKEPLRAYKERASSISYEA